MAGGRGRGAGGGPADGIAVAAVGDVVLAREDPAAAFARMAPLLRGADLRVANCEVPLSNRGLPQHAKHEVLHSSPEMIAGFVAAGFDVVSLANNHTMDYGPEALLETIERLRRHGIACCGAGLFPEGRGLPPCPRRLSLPESAIGSKSSWRWRLARAS